jgi:hypothetical protein
MSAFKRKALVASLSVTFSLSNALADSVSIPHDFEPDTDAIADQVDENFKALADVINENANSLDASDGDPTEAVFVDDEGNVGIVRKVVPVDRVRKNPRGLFHLQEINNDKNPADYVLRISANFRKNDGGVDGSNASIRFDENDGLSFTMGYDGGDRSAFYLDRQDGTTARVLTIPRVSGNVGIGTTDPQGKLDVNGAIFQRGTQLHADYVFEPNYKVESIEDHAEFMFTERHLKAVPKAKKDENSKEIVEYGSHLRGILEELEIAHVYISQLNKILKEQKTTIATLSEKIEMLEDKVK